MKKILFLSSAIMIFSMLFLLSCKKDKLRGIEVMNGYHAVVDNTPVIAPCDSYLTNNYIYPSGSSSFWGSVSGLNHFDYSEISEDNYSGYDELFVYFPGGSWPTKDKKYPISSYSDSQIPPDGQVKLALKIGNYYSSIYYYAQTGYVYVNVTTTTIKITFCDIQVKDSNNNTKTVSGKMTYAL